MMLINNWHFRTNKPGTPQYEHKPHKGTCAFCKAKTDVLPSTFHTTVDPIPEEQTRNGLCPEGDDYIDPREMETEVLSGDYCRDCHDMLRNEEHTFTLCKWKYRDAEKGLIVCY